MKKNQNKATSTVVANLRLDAQLINKNNYKLFYDRSIDLAECTSLKQLCIKLLEEPKQPYRIDLPQGLHIKWNPELATLFAIHSDINEKQFITCSILMRGGLQ